MRGYKMERNKKNERGNYTNILLVEKKWKKIL